MTETTRYDDGWLMDAFLSRPELSVPNDPCPEPDRVWSAVRGQLSASDTRAIVDHLASCGACTEAWRIAHDVAREDGAVALGRRPRQWAGWSIWSLAAAAVLVVSIGIFGMLVRRSIAPDGSISRDGGPSAVQSALTDGQPLSRRACALRWTPGPAGSRYVVHVATEDLTPIAIGRALTEPEYVVPEASLARVRSGAKLLWQVDVIPPGGARQTSPTFIVTVVDQK